MKLKNLLLAVILLCPLIVNAEEGFPLDRAPDRTNDLSSMQNGAKLFVNYCLNCHSASSMRYNRLRDLGLSEDQIRNNLILSDAKVGDLMKVAMTAKDGKAWFGVAPPDLSTIARAKASDLGSGADWLYTYLRTFYQDPTRPTGWNNMVFPNVAMPHVLWQLQGTRNRIDENVPDPENPSKIVQKFGGFKQVSPGQMDANEYDNAVADLVSYLQWQSEPVHNTRVRLGVWVILFLVLFMVLAWRLNASYWKDIK